MRCASCGSTNPEGARFCIECAAPLGRRCPGCGVENLPQAKFCARCGKPTLLIVEDLHWVDPSTLELLGTLTEQLAEERLFQLLTFRPDFRPPWPMLSHLTQLTLSRLARRQAEDMVESIAGGKSLPAEVVRQVIAKTDGVPLFVEELTKAVLESGVPVGAHAASAHRSPDAAPLPPLAIPATLHDSLMARLDRLAAVKALAQLGATLGREFSYALLQAVSPWDEDTVQ
ncbi:MAG TPA: zinc-ribbon domain-containing protein, partial [Vicinamibacterales bacterium]|nr:zinc-ribbon domain-containing protein [Vicinamibacterales bacterium]